MESITRLSAKCYTERKDMYANSFTISIKTFTSKQ